MRNTNLIIAITVFISMLAGCTTFEDENTPPYKTLKEAQLNYETVSVDQMLETFELGDIALTFYEQEEGYGVIEFSKSDNRWGIAGSALIKKHPDIPITLSGMTAGYNENKITVYLGQINDENIEKVIATIDGKEFVPQIVQGKLGTYLLYTTEEKINIDKEYDYIKGLDKDGNVIYEK